MLPVVLELSKLLLQLLNLEALRLGGGPELLELLLQLALLLLNLDDKVVDAVVLVVLRIFEVGVADLVLKRRKNRD